MKPGWSTQIESSDRSYSLHPLSLRAQGHGPEKCACCRIVKFVFDAVLP